IFQKIPDAFLAFLARLPVAFGHIRRHQNAETKGVISVAVLLEHLGKFLLGPVSLAAMAAGGEKVAVAALGDLRHRCSTARTGDPHRWKGLLQRLRPYIDVAEWKI